LYPSPNPWASPRGWFGLIVFVLCLVGLFMVYRAGSGEDENRPGGNPAEAPRWESSKVPVRPDRAEVERVVDGDTLVVDYEGESEYVRYIGIDTPESVKPGSPVECFGEESSRYNAALVEGRDVGLVFGPERRDTFGRLLAYVYVSNVMVNAEMVRLGYAETLTIPPNDARSGLFERLEREARRDGLGFWTACS
jgi:micrococcal nuclease